MSNPGPAEEPLPPSCSCHGIFKTFHSMMAQKEYTDFIIKVDGRTFEVHRMILAARSRYFEAMFRNPMKEKAYNMAQEKEIEKETFELLLEYFYTGKISKLEDFVDVVIEPAERYELDDLVKQCVGILQRKLNVNNITKYLVLSELLMQTGLRNAVIAFICNNMESVVDTENWPEITENFDWMTDIFRKLLQSRPLKVPKEDIFIDWEIPWNKFKPPGIQSSTQSYILDGKETHWLLGIYSDLRTVHFYLERLELTKPPLLLCTWELYQNTKSGKAVLMTDVNYRITTEEWTHFGNSRADLAAMSHDECLRGGFPRGFRVSLKCIEPSVTDKQTEQTFIAVSMDDEKFADATILVDTQVFKVHKVILSKQSQFLDKLFDTPQREYHLDDISPIVFDQLLCLMYTSEKNLNLDSVLLEILPVARKFKLREPLIKKCEDHLISRLQSSNALALYIHAEEVQTASLRSAALRVIGENIRPIFGSDSWKALKPRPYLITDIMKHVFGIDWPQPNHS